MKTIIKSSTGYVILFLSLITLSQNSCTTPKLNDPGDCKNLFNISEKILCKQEKIAYLKQEIASFKGNYKPKINHVFIHSSNISNKSIHFKKYYNNWIKKMMEFADNNMPESWRNITTTENVLIETALNQDGTLYKIKILRASNNKKIDDAIISLITKAAPFVPLPKELKDDVDILHIIAPFKFTPNV